MKESQLLMIVASLVLAAVGCGCLFLPAELLASAGMPETTEAVAAIQLFAAAMLGFAALNWSAKAVLIGGIYARPLAVGNFLHFAIGTIVLLDAQPSKVLLPAVVVYGLLAAWFGRILFYGKPAG